MFDSSDKEQRKRAYDYIIGRVDDFFMSSMYSNMVKRYEKRRDAFFMRPNSKIPRWRSKITFATYFLGVKMLEAQFAKSYSGSPFLTVGLQPGSLRSPEVDEKLKIANFDINRDLYTGRFHERFDRMRWYMEICGIGVAREYFAAEDKIQNVRSIATDAFGFNRAVENVETKRIERTVTEVIHPLNFAQEPTVHAIRDARWSAVRFLMKVSDLYRMRGDERYNQEDVNRVLEKLEAQGAPAIESSSSKDYYYDEYWDRNERTNNSVICVEYAGDFNFRGNYDDQGLYHAFLLPQFNAIIRCGKSPFGFKNHWKISVYPDTDTPYAIDPCAMLYPVWDFNNDFMNQYMDYVRSSMRVMYETYPGNIVGGLEALINGQSFGFAVADSEEAYKENANGLIRPVRKDQTGLPGFVDMVNFMDRYTAQIQPASSLKGMSSEDQLNKTATGIGFQASREDAWVGLLRRPLDYGLVDGLYQKLQNRINFSAEPAYGDIGGEQYEYFPYELGGPDYEFEVNRQPPDVLVGRIQQALQIATPYFQNGFIQPAGMAQLLKKMFELSGVPGASEMVKDPGIPAQIGTTPAAVEAAAVDGGGTDIMAAERELRDAAQAAQPSAAGAALALA